jgi:branched-subunit amino acid permease
MAELKATFVDSWLDSIMLAKRGLGWIMFQWVPYVENVPEGVVPILVCLYPYRCHMIMASVVKQNLYTLLACRWNTFLENALACVDP